MTDKLIPNMMLQGFLPGCLLFRKDVHVGVVDHYGVLLTPSPTSVVAHIDKAETGRLRVKQDAYETFAAGREVLYFPINTPVALNLMQQRIAAVEEKEPQYGLLAIGQDWNCESFASYISTGNPVSSQASFAKTTTWLMLAAVMVPVVMVKISEEESARRDTLRRLLAPLAPPPTLSGTHRQSVSGSRPDIERKVQEYQVQEYLDAVARGSRRT